MNNIIKRVWNQNRMVNIEDLRGMAFQAEDGGHTFEISGVNDAGESVPLSGTVAGVFIRPDGTDVALTGTASDGVVSVTLSDACYAVAGRFWLTIFVTADSQKVAVYAAVGTVTRTSGGAVAGDTPQDVVDLINAINAAVATIPADYTDLMAAVAPTYSDAALYVKGAYAWYDGVLYKAVVDILTAESFTAAHWNVEPISNALQKLEYNVKDIYLNTLNSALFGFGGNNYSYELGAIASANGLNTDSDKRIRTVGMFFCTKGTIISNTNNASNLYVMLYNMDGTYNGSSGGWVATYTIQSDSMVRITARKASDNPVIAENEISTLVSYIDISYKQMIPLDLSRGLTAYATDPFDANSLSVGMIAINNQTVLNNALNLPERAFGLLFAIQTNVATRLYQIFLTNTLNQRIWIRFKSGDTWFAWTRLNTSLDDSVVLGAQSFDWLLGYTVIASGTLSQSPKFACTQPRTVKQFDIITNTNNGLGAGNLSVVTMLAAYNGSTFVERVTLGYLENYIVPSGVDNVRLIFGYPSSVTTAPDMTSAQLRSYFSIKLYGDTARYFESTDGERPIYAAFGASTTIGAVHHKDGSITYSQHSYPEYIGQVLNLETHNLGVGSTGFLKRNGGNNNFCDQILNNATILSKAKLVTLMFGYGNDANPGLPIGSFDDFYPYDEDAYRSDDTAVMLERGATLFGLLNWCISYINENYPFAQLILIFGSPATNDIRTITKSAQTGSAGVAPYKLTFTDPYSSASVGSVNYRIKEIDTELAKLKSAMDIPIINLFFEGNCFDYYSTQAKDPDDNTSYALFSTTLYNGEPVFNRHPSDKGYLYFSRFIAGKIISEMKH